MIAAVCIREGVPLLHDHADFDRIAAVSELKVAQQRPNRNRPCAGGGVVRLRRDDQELLMDQPLTRATRAPTWVLS